MASELLRDLGAAVPARSPGIGSKRTCRASRTWMGATSRWSSIRACALTLRWPPDAAARWRRRGAETGLKKGFLAMRQGYLAIRECALGLRLALQQLGS